MDTAWIMYPARYPGGYDQPRKRNLHSTIIFLGDVEELPHADDILAALDFVPTVTAGFEVPVEGIDFFGPHQTEAVLRLTPTATLTELFDMMAARLARAGVPFHIDYPYTPHVTIDSHAAFIHNIPNRVLLGTPQLWYGDRCTNIGTARALNDTWTNRDD